MVIRRAGAWQSAGKAAAVALSLQSPLRRGGGAWTGRRGPGGCGDLVCPQVPSRGRARERGRTCPRGGDSLAQGRASPPDQGSLGAPLPPPTPSRFCLGNETFTPHSLASHRLKDSATSRPPPTETRPLTAAACVVTKRGRGPASAEATGRVAPRPAPVPQTRGGLRQEPHPAVDSHGLRVAVALAPPSESGHWAPSVRHAGPGGARDRPHSSFLKWEGTGRSFPLVTHHWTHTCRARSSRGSLKASACQTANAQ